MPTTFSFPLKAVKWYDTDKHKNMYQCLYENIWIRKREIGNETKRNSFTRNNKTQNQKTKWTRPEHLQYIKPKQVLWAWNLCIISVQRQTLILLDSLKYLCNLVHKLYNTEIDFLMAEFDTYFISKLYKPKYKHKKVFLLYTLIKNIFFKFCLFVGIIRILRYLELYAGLLGFD